MDWDKLTVVRNNGTMYTLPLVNQYIDMALETNDREWFTWLVKMKKFIMDREAKRRELADA